MHLHGLTSALDAATRAEAQRAGFDMLLTKPVEPSALLDAARRAGWVTDLTKTAAENLLDWLERQGCQHLTVTTSEQGTFGVRFSCPTGLRAKRDPDGGVSLVRVS
jgi:hypothetical protein